MLDYIKYCIFYFVQFRGKPADTLGWYSYVLLKGDNWSLLLVPCEGALLKEIFQLQSDFHVIIALAKISSVTFLKILSQNHPVKVYPNPWLPETVR